jgi:sporulation protein YlmC with PRC-barrel domain
VVDELHLARDLLDKQLVDAENRRMGKVDDLVVSIAAGRPPRIVAIEVGTPALARRVHPRLERPVSRWMRRLGVSEGRSQRIGMEKIVHFGNDVQVDVDSRRGDATAWERWLRQRFIARIPGSGA